VLSTVDRLRSPVDHARRPALWTALSSTGCEASSRDPSASAETRAMVVRFAVDAVLHGLPAGRAVLASR